MDNNSPSSAYKQIQRICSIILDGEAVPVHSATEDVGRYAIMGAAFVLALGNTKGEKAVFNFLERYKTYLETEELHVQEGGIQPKFRLRGYEKTILHEVYKQLNNYENGMTRREFKLSLLGGGLALAASLYDAHKTAYRLMENGPDHLEKHILRLGTDLVVAQFGGVALFDALSNAWKGQIQTKEQEAAYEETMIRFLESTGHTLEVMKEHQRHR